MGPSPHRKRRRPALACIACRHRKVKCDRNLPCGQCTRHKSATCSYAGDGPTPRNSHGQSSFHITPRAERNEDEVGLPIRPVDTSIQQGSAADKQCAVQQGQHTRDSAFHQLDSKSRTGHTLARLPRDNPKSNLASGTLLKTRIFGHGHWMSTYQSASSLPSLDPISHAKATLPQQANEDPVLEISDLVMKCKELARNIKGQRPSRAPLPAGIHQLIPETAVTNLLVQLYFDNFESCYRILHQPSFRTSLESYIQDRETAKASFVVQLLLVISCSAFLLDDIPLREYSRMRARTWIHTAQCWLSAPIEKDRLSVDGVQIHCLLLLARQVNCVGADLTWISAGSLLRMAIQIGLHQDPDHLGQMTPLQKEIRRRLWYTILEMNVQASLDSGMCPMITADDYETRPPSNLSDDDLNDAKQDDDVGIPTRASLQCLLASSIRIRLEAVKVINALHMKPEYDHVLRVADELMLACRNAATLIDQYKSVAQDIWPTDFPYSCCDHYHRRFILCIHLPYAVEALQNPIFSYSSKTGLEAALDLVSLLEDEMYHRLLVVGGGMFRDIMTRGAMLIFLELITQLEKDESTYEKSRKQRRREPLLKDARKIVQYAQDRLWHGETNVNGYVFVSMCMGQVDAMLCNSSVKDAIVRSAAESLAVCYDILQSLAANPYSTIATEPDLACWTAGGPRTVSSMGDFNLDFLNDSIFGINGNENTDFESSSTWFLGQWEERTSR